jgi:peptide/nickel transport system substrate-binding protein
MKKSLILGLMAVLFLSSIGTVSQVAATVDVYDTYPPMKYGLSITGAMIPDMDPQQAWDSASIDVIDQVVEPLFTYDISDPALPYKFCLATGLGTFSADKKNYTVTLREDVTFHNGDAFNATAVQKTFIRLNSLIEDGLSQIAELYEPLALNYPSLPLVINRTEIIDEFHIKFVLNYVYGAFEPLLTFSGSYIMNPTQIDDSWNATSGEYVLLQTSTDIVIGTGPYVLQDVADTQLTFVAYEDYWQDLPEIREMHWIKYTSATTLAQDFLAGNLHVASGAPVSFIAQFEQDPDLIVHPKMQTAVIQYIGFNCDLINKTMRQAISYAIDYDYFIDEIMQGNGVRMTSIVPTGMAYHVDCNVPIYNITHARTILCDADIAPASLTPTSDDAYWIGLSTTQPILSINLTYNLGNQAREDMATAARLSLRKIGVRCTAAGLDWDTYLDVLYNQPERLGLFNLGWAPDYNDPSNYLNPLLMSTSGANHCLYASDDLDAMMADALEITDPTAKAAAYKELQEIVAEDEMPFIHLMYGISRTTHSNKICNVPRNVMSKINFYYYSYSNVSICTKPTPTTTTTTTTTTEPEGPTVSGYGLVALIGVCALSIAAIVLKKHH